MREAKSVSYGNKIVVIPSIFNGKTASKFISQSYKDCHYRE